MIQESIIPDHPGQEKKAVQKERLKIEEESA
jgi:hypothetical protein